MYDSHSSSLFFNGVLGPVFKISCGVRQGCPLSSPLFVLTVYSFLRQILAYPHIHGLSLPGNSFLKLSVYADGITLFLDNNDSVAFAFQVYDRC